MKGRGYGLKGRTSFSLFRFGRRDLALTLAVAAADAAVIAASAFGRLDFSYYPRIAAGETDIFHCSGNCSVRAAFVFAVHFGGKGGSAMEILHIEDLTFRYPDAPRPALQNVSLSVSDGEFAVICGVSGCGKSTLLRLIKRELAPFGEKSGVIMYDGQPQEALDLRTECTGIGFCAAAPGKSDCDGQGLA